ncbi:Hypothetical predicted protein [Mytilus galloprovincialis]|uniref:DZIP3-like HEPN domain-containing protein n=1 Tax=Mytilus galloprovincialis TaxID=29158 RepID=A0A8B6F288_MYTGA|nr:Hypothetical predicted protein [Mytilus galloprovincialis]
MEAVLSDTECGYYMKLITFILGIGMEVLHTYFEQNILNAKEHMEFYMFLDKNKHNLFHECYPKVECCNSSQDCLSTASQKGSLTKKQFMLLFEIGPLTKMDHYKTGNHNYITKDCLCRIIAKQSNVVDCMDISLMYAIIQSCYIKHNIAIHGNPRCIEAIKDTRNFLAHVPSPRISKSEFDTRWAETEQAILEIGSSLGQYFAKVNQKKIEAFKRNDVSIEGIKGIIENNIDEIIKKKLQTFIEDQRTNAVIIKDEISEQLFKYKEEMKIEIRNLIFEVKPDAVAPCDIEKTFDSPVAQNNATACSPNVKETEENINATKRRVEWKLATPSTWNLPEIKDTLQKCSAQLRQWFEIENVFVGSLVIKTLVQQNVLDNREEFRASVHLFLEKFVEVCRINADVPTVIKVALIIELGEFEKEETEEQPSNLEINKKDKPICIVDNTRYDCQDCRQKDEIIANLKEELSGKYLISNV